MKKTTIFWTLLLFSAAYLLPMSVQNQPPKKVDVTRVIGAWTLEASVGSETYSLILELKVAGEKLEGSLSESNGAFTNAPLLELQFDGQGLKFGVKVPTPPDGSERLVKSELKLIDGKLEGTMTVEELGMSALIIGTKK